MSAPARPVTPSSILAARIGRLSDWIGADEELGALAPELCGELRELTTLATGLEPYVAACTSHESPALAALAAATRARDWEGRTGPGVVSFLEAEMLSGHVEGVLLRFLVRLSRAERALELGMFTGYSALAIAEALPAGGRLVACELDPDVAAFAQERFSETPAGERIEVRVGPAREALERMARDGETFDFVFIDADKAGYVDYVAAILDGGLLVPGGLICADNTLMQGEPWLPATPSPPGAAIAAFNATIAGDPRIEQVLLPLRDGVTLIQRVSS